MKLTGTFLPIANVYVASAGLDSDFSQCLRPLVLIRGADTISGAGASNSGLMISS